LHRLQGSTWIDESSSTWQLRWELAPPELVGLVGAYHVLDGNLATLTTQPVATYLSPNVVVPDGSCVVYLYAFFQEGSGPKVAVLGDSLVESLRDKDFNQTFPQGFVQGALALFGRRTEVEGQGGKRWSPEEGLTGRPKAESYMLDELRGLRTTSGGLRTIVIALGANDASWVAVASGSTEQQRRLDYVLNKMTEMLNEIATYGVCTVVVTPVDTLVSRGDPWIYAWASQAIGNYLRWVAGGSSTDWLRVEDWAAESRDHHTWNSEVWFISDNLHLNDLGRQKYTATLARAGSSC
jgi:lysophospholipase L1-like esterase